MTQYIDKSALVAEIKRRMKRYTTVNTCSKESDVQYRIKYHTLMSILSFLDTLEVKEVDLDSEITLWANAIPEIRLDDVERLATYFLELGLKAQKGE